MFRDLLTEYLPEFFKELEEQLKSDEIRWGDTWKKRGLIYKGRTQEQRFFDWLDNVRDQYENKGNAVPWMKVVGEAMICWVRENYS